MAIERTCGRREVLFAGVVLGVAWVSAGCSIFEEDDPPLESSLLFEDAKLEEGFQELHKQVSPEDRAVLDNEIVKRKDLLIHVLRQKLPSELSRGGACAPHLQAVDDGWCSEDRHPDAQGIRKLRDWDLVYDEQRAEEWEKETGIYNRLDTALYHEIFGHIVRILRSPRIMRGIRESKQRYNEFEKAARAIDNRYRRYRGYPIVPDVLPRMPKR